MARRIFARTALLPLLPLLASVLSGCSHPPAAPLGLPCHATAPTGTFTGTYDLDVAQAANATTIAAVATRLGLPDHAVTVALAAALQESKLYNLNYGDLDSLGLFQQRPSQGWGSPQQILTPRYAAAAFFTHLAQVSGWEALPVTDAVQAVQHSAAPDAYAQWEAEARVLAQALTGEIPAAFTCQTRGKLPAPATTAVINAAVSADLGTAALGVPANPARGWLIAGWLIAHAGQYGIKTITFDGQRWSGTTGAWSADHRAANAVVIDS